MGCLGCFGSTCKNCIASIATAEIDCYEEAFRSDPDVRSFNALLQRRMSHILSGLAFHGPSATHLDPLTGILGFLRDTNQKVLDFIKSKEDIWKSPNLSQLVSDYIESTSVTVQHYCNLRHCLRAAHGRYANLQRSLQRLQNQDEYCDALEDLRRFNNEGDPFTAEISQVLRSVMDHQLLLPAKLQEWKSLVGKKLKDVKAWRRISTVIFVSAFAAVVVCSVVAAALMAPPAVATLVSAATAALQPGAKWVYSRWESYVNVLKAQMNMMDNIECGCSAATRGFESIWFIWGRLRIQIERFVKESEIGIRDEHATRDAVGEMGRTLREMMEWRGELEKTVEECIKSMEATRKDFIRKFDKCPQL